MRARRPIKHPQLTLRHRHARFDWSHDRLDGLFAHGDGSTGLMKVAFLLRPTDGRARVWRQRNTSFQDNHILGTTAFGGGGVTVWGCFSFDCKLDLYVLDGNLTGQKYRDNVLAPRVVPYFDNHMRWLTGQCSWTTTLGHIEPELYNIFYSKRLLHGLRCRQT